MIDKKFSGFHADFIKQVGLGINISRTYPKGHPSLLPVIRRLKVLLKEVPIDQESISLIVIEDVIMIEDDRFSSKMLPIVKSLVDRFNQLAIKSITFNVDASDNDLKELFAAMAATSADIADYGDIIALINSKGITGVTVNKFRVGVISSDEKSKEINWETFLESMVITQAHMTEEEKAKELGSFLAGLGIVGDESAEIQTEKIVTGLEKLSLMVADQYGEDRWNEYSLVFSHLLAVLSPKIRKNILKYKAENKKLAALFRGLIPTMSDDDVIEIIATKAKEKTPATETEVVDILKNITGARLPDILSTLRVNVPELDFETVVSRLMTEMKTNTGSKPRDRFLSKNLETEMRKFFPQLRDPLHEERIKAIENLMEFSTHLYEEQNHNLIRLLVDRFDTMADAETEIKTFTKIIESLKNLYLKSKQLKLNNLVQFISKKFGKHLMRKEATFLERKNIIIKTINEIKDKNYVVELISLLWDPGTFVQAREALISLSDFSLSLLVETLKETEDRSVRMKIIDILVRIGEKSVLEIKKLLTSPEWFVRRNGIFILGEMKAKSAVDDIGGLINDREERVQLEAVDALHKISGEQVHEYIKKALNSKYKKVVIEAMKFLEKDDVTEKIVIVPMWLKSRKSIPSKKEEKFRCEIISVLGKMGDDSVIDALAEVLNEGALFKGDLLHPTKEAALNALVKIGSKKAIQTITDAVGHKDQFVAIKAQDILKRREMKHS